MRGAIAIVPVVWSLVIPSTGRGDLPVEVSAASRDLVGVPGVWRYSCGLDEPPPGWTDPGFDDAAWCTGLTPFGFGESPDEINTDVSSMAEVRIRLCLRTELILDGPPGDDPLDLEVDYDDGFFAWVNGREVARRGFPEGPVDPGEGAENHESGLPEVIRLGPASEILVEGRNVVAVDARNSSLASGDFLIAPALSVGANAWIEGSGWVVDGPIARLGGTIGSPWQFHSVLIDGAPARMDWSTEKWSGRRVLEPGRNVVEVQALDGGGAVLDSASLEIVYLPGARPPFVRGDANADGAVDLADAIRILIRLFAGGEPLECEKSGDADASGAIEVADAIRLLGALFLEGPLPEPPFPACGGSAGPGGLPCAGFAPCRASVLGP